MADMEHTCVRIGLTASSFSFNLVHLTLDVQQTRTVCQGSGVVEVLFRSNLVSVCLQWNQVQLQHLLSRRRAAQTPPFFSHASSACTRPDRHQGTEMPVFLCRRASFRKEQRVACQLKSILTCLCWISNLCLAVHAIPSYMQAYALGTVQYFKGFSHSSTYEQFERNTECFSYNRWNESFCESGFVWVECISGQVCEPAHHSHSSRCCPGRAGNVGHLIGSYLRHLFISHLAVLKG